MAEVRTGYVTVDRGVRLYYEDTAAGAPIVFVHEWGGDYRSWEPQVRHLSRRFRCVTFNARGFPPSSVPKGARFYSQDIFVEDVVKLLDHLKIDKAHVVGCSMGSYTTLFFGLRHPERARSITVVGCGYGSEDADWRRIHEGNMRAFADELEREGMDSETSRRYTIGTTRIPHALKDPRGWMEFDRQFREHSNVGAAMCQRHVIIGRPSMFDQADDLANMRVPMMVVTGDEDWPCLNPGMFMKKTSPTCSLVVIPRSGHAVNLEEPALFNLFLADFVGDIEMGTWRPRDPRGMAMTKLQAPKEAIATAPTLERKE
ncbi:MAG: alpha/beta hydrolase [Proteobacteria bacterium]|nr:alpha/beta hydrolase [Pseudomonadota bacterium]